MGYISYNKKDLIDKIDKISIESNGNQVITKYGDRVIYITNVSRLYEIFDIRKYLKEKIDEIEKNFTITKYNLVLNGGKQELSLLSDSVNIGGIDFYKSFFILNSSDKSRRLNFNIGLYSESKGLYAVSNIRNIGISRKHIRGVTHAAEFATVGLNDETFNEQIECIQSLVGKSVLISKIRNVIIGEDDTIKNNHLKFDAFKNSILYYNFDKRLSLNKDQKDMLRIPSERLTIDNKNDFYVDAFWAFQVYMKIFNRQDSYIIKKETERILNITQWAIRNERLKQLIGV